MLAVLSLLALSCAVLPGCSSSAGSNDEGPASVPNVSADGRKLQATAAPYLVGRFQAEGGGQRFAWSGSSMSARFSGTGISVDLAESGTNQYAVVIDDVVQPTKLVPEPGRKQYELATRLPNAVHTVTLHKLTEPLLGEATFFGFQVTDGKLLPYFVPPDRRIEVIGDSTTCGYGIEGADETCPFSAGTENHYRTYEAIAARELGAELVTTAWSGKGVFSNRGSTVDPLPVLWPRTLPNRSDSTWDFARYQPQVVVIGLGTNDMAPNVVDKTPFPEAYEAFLSNVRKQYPNAVIFCALGPMLSDWWPPGENILSLARSGIKAAIDDLTARGDTKLRFLEYPAQNGKEGYGCDWHPSLQMHQLMAEQLTGAIRNEMGW